MTFRAVVVLLSFFALFVGGSSYAAPSQSPIRVLIVDGYSNHDWRLTTALIRGILEPTGLFAVSVSTAPPTKDSPGWDEWRPKFADYDVIIQYHLGKANMVADALSKKIVRVA